MQQTQWNLHHIKQCKQKFGQAMLSDEHMLVSFSEDFGKLVHTKPAVIFEPTTLENLQSIIQYANKHTLPLTIRGNGMSQNGQSLAAPGGAILHMKEFSHCQEPADNAIWIEANATWATLLDYSLKNCQVPYVTPYNCNLSIAGVLSAGGVGASSFKYGGTTHHVKGLEVITAEGECIRLDENSPLLQACLGGQGRFGVITQAQIQLRPCLKNVRTFYLVYLDQEAWLADLKKCKRFADYMECFCSPAIQGAKLSEKGRFPFAQWLYSIHVSVEFDDDVPAFTELGLAPWKLLHTQDETIHSYLHRHDSRFNAMKITGQWDLPHPWYECFVTASALDNLETLLSTLPVHYASVVQVVPVAKNSTKAFFMTPDTEDVFALMILNPGLPQALIPSCLETIKNLDNIFLPKGGKRYLSGFLGAEPGMEFWKNHFGEQYDDWIKLKQQYDPKGVFCSYLHKE